MQLTPTQARVLGSLIEKQLATPQQYPLTLNALVAACNQTSNRDPVMDLTEQQVRDALEALREKRLARVIHPGSGSRVTKFRQVAEEHFDLQPGELALLGVLLLRGPQTPGELRSRTGRMWSFGGVGEVEAALKGLSGRQEPLVDQLERQPGQKEARYAQLLAGTPAAASAGGAVTAPRGAARIPRPPSPRIRPLSEDEQDDEVRELLDGVAGGGSASNIFTTLARHPGLFRRWLPFGGKLLQGGKLPPRDRELAILRTAWLCRSDYEWGQHVVIARQAGVTDAEIERIVDGPDADAWGRIESALLRAVDELHFDGCIAEGTWHVLAERYDDRQLIEVPMLIGHYHLVAFTLNSLGVQREPGVPGLPKGVAT